MCLMIWPRLMFGAVGTSRSTTQDTISATVARTHSAGALVAAVGGLVTSWAIPPLILGSNVQGKQSIV